MGRASFLELAIEQRIPHLQKLVIFDCDGVLVDSEPIVNRVFVDMMAELGHSFDYGATLREFSGGSMSKRLAATRDRLGVIPEGFVEQFDRRLAEALSEALRPVPGVLQVLNGLSTPWCVASNGTKSDIRARLGFAGLLEHFDPRAFSATEVPRSKPAPDVFLHAAKEMGVSVEDCTVVEDSVPGVTAGVDAGMFVLGFARFTSAEALRSAGARVFDDMSLLSRLLNEAAV